MQQAIFEMNVDYAPSHCHNRANFSALLNPDLVLFDEPTMGLDPVAAYHLCELIVHLNQAASVTILVVTHDLQSAFRFATRIAILDQGRIVEEGLPETIRQSRNPIVAQFLRPGSKDVLWGSVATLQLPRDGLGRCSSRPQS